MWRVTVRCRLRRLACRPCRRGGGAPRAAYPPDRPLVVVLGNEGRGLRPLVARACDEHLTIPLPGLPEGGSLNVASAAAVLLYHLMTFR